MFQTFRQISRNVQNNFVRTFLSNSYYCNEVWQKRLNAPILQTVKPDDFYYELDQVYQKSKNLSAVDVDIFANSLHNEGHNDELLDILHKLRLSADTFNTLYSTSHAVIRYLLQTNCTEQLLTALDDRLNYGIFLDNFSANILMDHFWKKEDFKSGARVATQIMLQEDFNHALVSALSLLHCYKFLLNPIDWPEPEIPEEPKEEVKIRVKYIRNPYFDDHFDLRDPLLLVGKTLYMICSDMKNAMERTLSIIGLTYFKKNDEALKLINEFKSKELSVYLNCFEILPEDSPIKMEVMKLSCEDGDLLQNLIENVKKSEKECSERDIAEQCKMYLLWEQKRDEALEKQQKRVDVSQRLEAIKETKIKLQEKETKLWFFDNEEKLELEIDSKKVFYPKRWFGTKKKPRKVDEGYIPPEILKQRQG